MRGNDIVVSIIPELDKQVKDWIKWKNGWDKSEVYDITESCLLYALYAKRILTNKGFQVEGVGGECWHGRHRRYPHYWVEVDDAILDYSATPFAHSLGLSPYLFKPIDCKEYNKEDEYTEIFQQEYYIYTSQSINLKPTSTSHFIEMDNMFGANYKRTPTTGIIETHCYITGGK